MEIRVMKQILVYGDSLTWGIMPGTRERLPFSQRWPGIVEGLLGGGSVRMIEDCLNGRRTVYEDPLKAGRNGLTGLAQRIEVNSPLALVVVMLGTNDFQWSHPFVRAWSAAQGVATLVREIRQAPIEPGMAVAPVLMVCPPPPVAPQGPMVAKFPESAVRCAGLSDAYRETALALGCEFFDASALVKPSEVDGVHLDAAAHRILGEAIAPVIAGLI
jgi:lysophospholipase L1-like esterase